jgi:hypothetical protein
VTAAASAMPFLQLWADLWNYWSFQNFFREISWSEAQLYLIETICRVFSDETAVTASAVWG